MIEVKSIQIQVYDELKKNIMDLRLPPGTAMSTQEMATRMNVSRTPVRESFLRLQSEGLVDIFPQRQTRVSRISLKRVAQEKFLRECLEVGVINEFLQKGRPEYILKMAKMVELQKKCFQENAPAAFVDADDRFHRAMFECAGQQIAWDAIEMTSGHYNRFRVLLVKRADVIESSIRQHEKILSLLRRGDEEAVRFELTAHFRRVDIQKTGLTEEYPDYFEESTASARDHMIKGL